MSSMQGITETFRRHLLQHSQNLFSIGRDAAQNRDSEDFAISAFRGGDRQVFKSEDEVHAYYRQKQSELKEKGEKMLGRFIDD